jgi:hypothetical protein
MPKKDAARSMREIAERRVARYLRENLGELVVASEFEDQAADIVSAVLDAFSKPDQAMIDAGFAELKLAVPKQVSPGNVRLLAKATWHAMVARTG